MGWDNWNGDGINADAKPPNVEKNILDTKNMKLK